MSWEHYIKEEVCPCGRGKIIWDEASDDWNRYRCEIKKIDCDYCQNNFHVEQFMHIHKCDQIVDYYLTPNSIAHQNLVKCPLPNSFIEFMVYEFTNDEILLCYKEIGHYTSYNAVPKSSKLHRIIEIHYRYNRTRKMRVVENNLRKSYDEYYSFDDNCEKYNVRKEQYKKYKENVIKESHRIGNLC